MELESSPCARAGEKDGIGDGSKVCVCWREKEREKEEKDGGTP